MENERDRARALCLMSWLFVIGSLTFDPDFSCVGGTNDKVWARDKGCFQESLVNDDVHSNVMPPNHPFWYIFYFYVHLCVCACYQKRTSEQLGELGLEASVHIPTLALGTEPPSSLHEPYVLLTAKLSISPILCLNIFAHLLVAAFSMC